MPACKVGNTWRCTFYYQSGEKRRKKNKRGFKTKKEAQEWERNFLLKSNGSTDMTFSSLTNLYIEDCNLRMKFNTCRATKYTVEKKLLPFFKNYRINEISTAVIRDWQNMLLKTDLKVNTVKTYNSILKSIFQYAVDYLDLLKNPVIPINKPSEHEEKIIITSEELEVLLKNEKKEIYRCFMIVLFWTGMRAGELFALTLDDFDLERKKVRINKSITYATKEKIISTPKTKNGNREIDINSKIVEAIEIMKEKLYNKKSRIFDSLSTTNTFRHIRRLGEKCNIDKLGLHTFRHSHASYLFSKGVDILSISKRLGHASVSTTMDIYTHLLEETSNKLKEALE